MTLFSRPNFLKEDFEWGGRVARRQNLIFEACDYSHMEIERGVTR